MDFYLFFALHFLYSLYSDKICIILYVQSIIALMGLNLVSMFNWNTAIVLPNVVVVVVVSFLIFFFYICALKIKSLFFFAYLFILCLFSFWTELIIKVFPIIKNNKIKILKR